MKNICYSFVVFLLLSHCTTAPNMEAPTVSMSTWSKEKQAAHLLNRQDSTTWDTAMFNNDLAYIDFSIPLPIHSGIFPVPQYNLLGTGSFNGVGNFGYPGGDAYEELVQDKKILYNSFFVGKSELNKAFVGEKKDEIFFHIMVLTDNIDTVDYSHVGSQVISRNHPDYIGQGFYKMKDTRVDYTAFITAERKPYAIVNMRLFDLSDGKTILIAPQKDKSFRSMQVNSPKLSSQEIETYSHQLLQEQRVIDFFTKPGNI